MALAVANGIEKCVSTDTVREVVRLYSMEEQVHRPSYGGSSGAVKNWDDSVMALEDAVANIIRHTIKRNNSLVLEGVAISPSNKYVDMWRAAGGVAVGILIKISDRNQHHIILRKRGYYKQLSHFERIRLIQDEMDRRASYSDWLVIEQSDIQSVVDKINEAIIGIGKRQAKYCNSTYYNV